MKIWIYIDCAAMKEELLESFMDSMRESAEEFAEEIQRKVETLFTEARSISRNRKKIVGTTNKSVCGFSVRWRRFLAHVSMSPRRNLLKNRMAGVGNRIRRELCVLFDIG